MDILTSNGIKVINNITTTDKWTTIIAVLSLIVSLMSFIYSLMKHKDKVAIKWHDKAVHLSNPAILFYNYTTIPPAFTKQAKSTGESRITSFEHDPYLAQVTIVNYGDTDIGYFGLKAVDQNKISYPIVTNGVITKTYGLKYVLELTNNNNNGINWRSIHVPNDDHGIIKAHSYHIWNVIISGDFHNIKRLRFQIGLARKHWYNSSKSNSFKGVNKTYYIQKSIINKTSNRFNRNS